MGNGKIGFEIREGHVVTAKKFEKLTLHELAYFIMCIESEINRMKNKFTKLKNEKI